VLPVTGTDGITRIVRACVDGPVFRADLVRWDDVGTIPFDALGAPGWRRGEGGSEELPSDPDGLPDAAGPSQQVIQGVAAAGPQHSAAASSHRGALFPGQQSHAG
jgi:hypothetical protein